MSKSMNPRSRVSAIGLSASHSGFFTRRMTSHENSRQPKYGCMKYCPFVARRSNIAAYFASFSSGRASEAR